MAEPGTNTGGSVLKLIPPEVPKRHWLFCFWADNVAADSRISHIGAKRSIRL
jgi:hypothetical protein